MIKHIIYGTGILLIVYILASICGNTHVISDWSKSGRVAFSIFYFIIIILSICVYECSLIDDKKEKEKVNECFDDYKNNEWEEHLIKAERNMFFDVLRRFESREKENKEMIEEFTCAQNITNKLLSAIRLEIGNNHNKSEE